MTHASAPASSMVGTRTRYCLGPTVRAAHTVKNHGIPEEKIGAALEAMKTYFALPLEEKMKVFYTAIAAIDMYRVNL